MNVFTDIFETIGKEFSNASLNLQEILAMLIVILFISLYEFLIYRIVQHRSFYNSSFHVTIMVLPFFIGAIVKSLQSNLAITLGTIGALAIIRFRTAVKDPIDMVYLLWSVFIGIMCGCSLYELCFLTSIMVTIVLFITNLFGSKLFKKPYCIIVNANEDIEKELKDALKKNTSLLRLKSRNYTSNGVDYIFECSMKNVNNVVTTIKEFETINKYSIVEYDNNDVI